jgi:hypothetical protein
MKVPFIGFVVLAALFASNQSKALTEVEKMQNALRVNQQGHPYTLTVSNKSKYPIKVFEERRGGGYGFTEIPERDDSRPFIVDSLYNVHIDFALGAYHFYNYVRVGLFVAVLKMNDVYGGREINSVNEGLALSRIWVNREIIINEDGTLSMRLLGEL